MIDEIEQCSANPVLIVEDDPDVSSSLQLIVESYFGVPGVVVEDGLDVPRLARSMNARLILLDLALPGADGCAICSQLKSSDDTRHIPVVVVSSSPWGLEETRRRVAAAGADTFYHKLYEFHRLVPVLARYLQDSEQGGKIGVT